MWSARWSASSRYWVVSSTVVPSSDELADERPDVVARLRVEPGRRLVEDQEPRPPDEAGAEVEAPAHAARVAAHHAVGGVLEAEPLERLGGTALGLASAEAVEAADHLEVLAAGERAVDRGELAGQADQRAHARRVAHDVAAEHARAAGSGAEQRREHAYERGLARAVRPEQALHRAGRDDEVDAIESPGLAERDGDPFDLDCLCARCHDRA